MSKLTEGYSELVSKSKNFARSNMLIFVTVSHYIYCLLRGGRNFYVAISENFIELYIIYFIEY